MSLIKVRNIGKSILFIDSLGLILRPGSKSTDFTLVDEEKSESDPQFMKCKLLKQLETCKITEDFKPVVDKKEKVVKGKVGRPKKGSKEENKEKDPNDIEDFVEPPEPKNRDAVVVIPGSTEKSARTARVKPYKLSDMKLPRFIDQDNLRDLTQENIDDEEQGPPDVILSEQSDE